MSKPTSYSVADKNGMMSHGEIDLLKKFTRMLPHDGAICIIGAGAGTSSMAILEERPDLHLFSVDTVFPTGGMYEPGEKQNLIDAGLWALCNIIQIQGDSADIGKMWPNYFKFDMVLVDGDHRYDAVVKDISLWAHRVVPGGYMLFHDYADKEIKPKAGVKEAVDAMMSFEGFEKVELERWLIVLEKYGRSRG